MIYFQRSQLILNVPHIDYTYPPIVDPKDPRKTVQVDKQYDPSMQDTYIGILQRALGLSTAQASENLSVLHPPMFTSKHAHPLPSGYLSVEKFRHFVILGELPEYAFGGSYKLELFLVPETAANREYDSVFTLGSPVGVISVLGRENPARCAACVGRQKDSRPVRGHISLQPKLVHDLLESHGLNHGNASTEAIEALLTSRIFAARIVTPGGKVLAKAYPPALSAPEVQGEPIAPERSPRLTLLSNAVAHDQEHVVHYYDARSHGCLLDCQWREVADR
jgi:tyrosinase